MTQIETRPTMHAPARTRTHVRVREIRVYTLEQLRAKIRAMQGGSV